MNSIKQKPNIQNLQNKQTIKNINKITKSFRSAGPNQRVKMLKVLASEINTTQNNAVKNWLVKFDTILRSLEAAK